MSFRSYQQRVGEAIERIERLDEEELEYGYRMAVYGTLYAMNAASYAGSMRNAWKNREQRMLTSASTLASRLGDKVDSLESKMLDDIENQRYCFNSVESSTKAKKDICVVLSITTLYSVGGKVDVEGSLERKLPRLKMDEEGGYHFGNYSICKDGSGWIIYEHFSEEHIDYRHSFTDRDDAVAWAARNYLDRKATATCGCNRITGQTIQIPVTKWAEVKTRVNLLREARQWLGENVEGCARYA